MIFSDLDRLRFLEKCYDAYLEHLIFQNNCNIDYVYGGLHGKYSEHDQELIAMLRENVTDDKLENEVKKYIKSKIFTPINNYTRLQSYNINTSFDNERFIEQLKDLEHIQIDEWLHKYYRNILNTVKDMTESEQRMFMYLWFAYENFVSYKDFNENMKLKEVYGSLYDQITQLKKYNLLPIDDIRELLILDPPRIYDKNIDKTFFVCSNISKLLLRNLKKMYDQYYNTQEKLDLSIRPANSKIHDGKYEIERATEELERGKYFLDVTFKDCSVTKLYSKDYHDFLWVIVDLNSDSNDITFEETYKYNEIDNEEIITQVIHLQFEIIADNEYIKHIDHEYVFYTNEEYLIRQDNPSQKGNARKRVKTFKIDNALIPFNFKCEVCEDNLSIKGIPILPFVLLNFFKCRDLIMEYFSGIDTI